MNSLLHLDTISTYKNNIFNVTIHNFQPISLVRLTFQMTSYLPTIAKGTDKHESKPWMLSNMAKMRWLVSICATQNNLEELI